MLRITHGRLCSNCVHLSWSARLNELGAGCLLLVKRDNKFVYNPRRNFRSNNLVIFI